MTIIDLDQRPLVDLSFLCSPVRGEPRKLCFRLPGGVELCTNSGALNTGALEYVKDAVNTMNTAMSPLVPTFRIMEAVLAIQKCVVATFEVVTNPDKLKQAALELAEKCTRLLELMPVLSIPFMAVDILDTLIATLDGLATETAGLIRFFDRITQAQLDAAESPSLLSIIRCSEASLAQQLDNISTVFASINPQIVFINTLADIAQMKAPFPIKLVDLSFPTDPENASKYLLQVSRLLQQVRAVIPVDSIEAVHRLNDVVVS